MITNLDAMCQLTFDRHHEILAQAARRRLLSSGLQERATPTGGRAAWRVTVAAWLRRSADRLEPVADNPQIAMLRAVAHREISVDQAMRLLDAGNGHRSAIV